MPIISLYLNYYVSQKKTKLVAWLLIGSTLINIILNYVGINYGLRFGEFEAVLGACFATIISRIFYLVGLGVFRRRKGKLFN
jgi:Na+-driven multidrug efflux pump